MLLFVSKSKVQLFTPLDIHPVRYALTGLLKIAFSVTTQPLNMEFLPQIAQIYADLKPPKVVYWRKLIKKDFILICDVCVICGKYLFMNSLNRLSSYLNFLWLISDFNSI